ncbi:MAG TPA: ABC transporter permease [Candidatus Binatia bacterium]|jgi:peptide/nickel transport system permease protein
MIAAGRAASWRRVRRLCVVLAAAAAIAIIAGWAMPQAGRRIVLAEGLAPPSLSHPLGQDRLGRDVLGRCLGGARVSLLVATAAVAVSVTVGTAVGAAAGLSGGTVDLVLMRAVDVLLAFPGLLVAIALAAALGPGTANVVVALSVLGWTGYARLVRAEVRRVRRRDHVEAAVALGASPLRVALRHVLPLVAAPVLVQATFTAAAAVVAEASLSFLGIGIQPPSPSWGSMLAEARSFLVEAPWLVIGPGVALTSLALALQLLGDALRDALDVKTTLRTLPG